MFLILGVIAWPTPSGVLWLSCFEVYSFKFL